MNKEIDYSPLKDVIEGFVLDLLCVKCKKEKARQVRLLARFCEQRWKTEGRKPATKA